MVPAFFRKSFTILKILVSLLIGIFIDKSSENREKHNLDVKRHRPVLDIKNIELNPSFYGSIAAVAVDLRPARKPRPHLMLDHVTGNLLLKLLQIGRAHV